MDGITKEQLMLLIEQLINDNTVGEITALDARTVFLQIVGKIDQTDVRLQAVADIANMGRDMAAANALKDTQQDGRLNTEEAATIRIDGEISTIKGMITTLMEAGPTSGLTPADVQANAAERESNKEAIMAEALKVLGLTGRVDTLEANELTQNTAIARAQTTADGAKSTADSTASGLTNLMGRVGTAETEIDVLQTLVGDGVDVDLSGVERQISDLNTKTDTTNTNVETNRQGLITTNQRIDNLPDVGSGVTDEQAQDIIDNKAGVADLVSRVDANDADIETNKQGLVSANNRIDGIVGGSGVTQDELDPLLDAIRETDANNFERFGNKDVNFPSTFPTSSASRGRISGVANDPRSVTITPPTELGFEEEISLSVDYVYQLFNGGLGNGGFSITVSQNDIQVGGVTGDTRNGTGSLKVNVVAGMPVVIDYNGEASGSSGNAPVARLNLSDVVLGYVGDFVNPTNALINSAIGDNNTSRDTALPSKVNPLIEQYVENNNVKSEPEDYITEQGSLAAQNPGNEFSGANGDDIAFGFFTLSIDSVLTNLATRAIQVSEMYFYSGFRNQRGAESEFYYVIEQASATNSRQRLVGHGSDATDTPTRQEIEANWVQIENEYDEISFTSPARTGGNQPIIRFACIFTGEAGTFVPRLTSGKLSFIGRLRNSVAGVVHDELDDELMMLKDADIRIEGKADANTETGATNSAAIDAERDLIDGVRTKLAKDSFEVIDRAVVSQTDTVTLDGTDLNTQLGGSGGLFANQFVSGAIGDAIRFTTKMTRASDVLVYGAGQVARVIDSRVVGYELIEPRDEQRNDVEKYITDARGFGSRTQPINLPFGVNGQAADNERFVSIGYPETGAIVDNIAFLITTIINGNRTALSTQLTLEPHSGQSVPFVVPGINGVTFTATDQNGTIRLSDRNTGAGGQVAANASIDIVIAYDETIVTPAVARGQRAIDLGPFTGNNIIGFDIGRVGNDDVNTLHIVTPTQRYNTGYFLNETHRQELDTDNMGFTFFTSIAGVAYTPAALAQLVADDPYLGLFARTNHEVDSFNLGTQLVIKLPTGANVDVGARLEALVPTSTGTVNEMRLGAAESKIETNISNISTESTRNDGQDGLISGLRTDLNSAVTTAGSTQTTANNALSRANAANTAASNAQATANSADGKADSNSARLDDFDTDKTRQDNLLSGLEVRVGLNDAKVGVDEALLNRVSANDAKVGVDSALLDRVTANDAKVGITGDEQTQISTATAVNNTQNQTLSNHETRIAANDAKVGVDEALLNRVTANDAKPDDAGAKDIAEATIVEQLEKDGTIRDALDEIVISGGGVTKEQADAIAANTEKVGITEDQATAIVANSNKISYTPEREAVTTANSASIANHDLLFGAKIVGDWESGDDLTFAPGITTLNMGDLVTQDGKVFEALESGLDDQTSADAPDANPSAWRDYSIQTQPYDDSALSGRVTTVESDVQTLKNNPVGNTLTPQEVAQALADNQATNPLHYNVKFSQDTTRQVAEQFRANVFDTQNLKDDSTDTSMILKLLPDNTSVPNNVLNAIPFDSRWEGALRVSTLDNGSGGDVNRNTLLRVSREFKHFVGQVDEAGNSLEFTEYRRYIFRMTKEYAQDIPMNIFNTSVQLPENVTSDVRYTRLATQNIEINIIFELFGDQADVTNNNPSARNTLPGAFNVDWDGVGVRYSQLAPVANTGDVYTDAMAKAQATEALAEGLASGGDIETAIEASSGAKASDLARGVFQLDLSGSGGTNFTIPLPTDTLPGETTLSGVLTIQSVGGFTPSGYTYNVRYSDGDRAIIFGNTTVPYTAGGTVINLVNYDISHGRPIEIDIGVNGGGGSTHPWTLALSVGSGEEGVLYSPTIDLINMFGGATPEQVTQLETNTADIATLKSGSSTGSRLVRADAFGTIQRFLQTGATSDLNRDFDFTTGETSTAVTVARPSVLDTDGFKYLRLGALNTAYMQTPFVQGSPSIYINDIPKVRMLFITNSGTFRVGLFAKDGSRTVDSLEVGYSFTSSSQIEQSRDDGVENTGFSPRVNFANRSVVAAEFTPTLISETGSFTMNMMYSLYANMEEAMAVEDLYSNLTTAGFQSTYEGGRSFEPEFSSGAMRWTGDAFLFDLQLVPKD